jgi:putative Ca2+/H+ antiporter (TMEM165/GDT1 family)
MEALLASFGIVFLAELGDKTQFLSLYLAATYRKPIPVLAGIFIATLASNIVAGLFGHWIGEYLTPNILRWTLTLSFVAFAIWALLPEKPQERSKKLTGQRGAFIGTLVGFFVAELGDKTQIVTAALSARYDTVLMVIIGSTAGMMAANLPAVIGGHYFAGKVPSRIANRIAAIIFAVQAVLTYLGIETF